MNAMFEKRKDEDFVRDNITPKTNADRIRSMSDEELAEFLCGVYDEEEGKFINGIVIQNYDEDRIAEWLKSEAKE